LQAVTWLLHVAPSAATAAAAAQHAVHFPGCDSPSSRASSSSRRAHVLLNAYRGS
jgi:hypothetical protein